MAIAKIENGVITEVLNYTDEIPDSNWLPVIPGHASYLPGFYHVGESTFTYDALRKTVTENINLVPNDIESVRAAKLGFLADYRWEQENGGTMFNGMPIPTDADTQRKILGAQVSVLIDPNYTINNWKVGFDTYITLNADLITALSVQIRGHIQDCFDNSAAHSAAIMALTDPQAVIDYDFTTGWPS